MNLSSRSFALLPALLLLTPSAVEGRQGIVEIDVVERVLAVVGDSVILQTELDQFLLGMEASGWQRPQGADELQEAQLQVLDQLINQQLITQEAAKDTLLEISEEELEDRVQREIEGHVRQFGTLGRLQEDLAAQGMTLAVFRELQKNLIRRQLLQERYFAKRGQDASAIVVTEEEARTYWDENQDLIPERPASILFENIQLQPEAEDAAKAVALAEADSIRELIRDGEDFADLAARFSDDPSAADGSLDWIREDGRMVKEFEEVAFQLAPGVIPPPVETSFGYHLILVERVRGAERRVSHILISPEITESDIEAHDARAQSFADRLRAGETMADLGEEPDTVDLTLQQITQASRELGVAMQNALMGDVVGPITVAAPRTENGWLLARVLRRTSGGASEFSDFRDVIVQRLQEQRLTETVIEELRNRAYIDIRLGGG